MRIDSASPSNPRTRSVRRATSCRRRTYGLTIGDCRRNCSFPSGEASAALAPPQWRPLAYAAAISFGTIISISRIVMGGHFLSDTIFAGVLTFLTIWLLYALLYRWKSTKLDDDTMEKALERLSAYCGTIYSRMTRRGGAGKPLWVRPSDPAYPTSEQSGSITSSATQERDELPSLHEPVKGLSN